MGQSLAQKKYNQLKVRDFLTFAVSLDSGEISRIIAQLQLLLDDKNNKNNLGENYLEIHG